MGQQRLFQVPVYFIDASALINITRYPGYPQEVFPTIWIKLEDMAKGDELISHIEVYKEIETEYEPEYWNNETNKGGPWADPWLIALSICEDAIIVTDEKNAPNHIPYIASHFNIQCLNLIDFFKKIGIKY